MVDFKFLLLAIFIYVASAQHCASTGRFRARDPTCSAYYLCVKSNGDFVSKEYICPKGSIFNPSTNRCSTEAQCIDNICDSFPDSVTLIPDPNGKNCKTYINCASRNPVIESCGDGFFNKDLLPEPGCDSKPNC